MNGSEIKIKIRSRSTGKLNDEHKLSFQPFYALRIVANMQCKICGGISINNLTIDSLICILGREHDLMARKSCIFIQPRNSFSYVIFYPLVKGMSTNEIDVS